jgi:hypothetical protein
MAEPRDRLSKRLPVSKTDDRRERSPLWFHPVEFPRAFVVQARKAIPFPEEVDARGRVHRIAFVEVGAVQLAELPVVGRS